MKFYDYQLRFKDAGGAAMMQRLARAAGATQAAVTAAGEKGSASLGRLRMAAGSVTEKIGTGLKTAFEDAASASESAFGRMRTALSRFRREADGAGSSVKRGADGRFLPGAGGNGGAGRGGGMLSNTRGMVGGLAVGAAAYGLAGAVRDTASAQGVDNAIRFSGGAEGARNLAFVNQEADRLGLNLGAAKEGFKTLSGSMMGTQLQGEGTRKLFDQVASATTVMGLSGDDQKGVFLAIGQIMSKGKVAAEELRGQIGERLPGAFKIAADAMGVTQAQLGKLMEQGKISSADFLPKFGAQLEKTFGAGLATATNSLQANLNRFDSLWERTKTGLVTRLLPAVLAVMKGITYLAGHLEPVKQVLREVWAATLPIQTAFGRVAQLFGLTGNASQLMAGSVNGISAVLHRLMPVVNAVGRVIGGVIDLAGRLGKVLLRELGSDTMSQILDTVMITFSVISRMVERTTRGIGQIINGISRGSVDQVFTGVKTMGSSLDNLPRYYHDALREVAKSKLAQAAGVPKESDAKKLLDKGEKGDLTLGANPDLEAAANGASGAGQVRNVTVNIGKFQDSINIHTTQLKDAGNQVVSELEEWMVRAVTGAEMVLQ